VLSSGEEERDRAALARRHDARREQTGAIRGEGVDPLLSSRLNNRTQRSLVQAGVPT
jgi:hypothetical protein